MHVSNVLMNLTFCYNCKLLVLFSNVVLTEHPLKLMNINPCAVFNLVCKVSNFFLTIIN